LPVPEPGEVADVVLVVVLRHEAPLEAALESGNRPDGQDGFDAL
jgi:hypothetical protein